MRDKRKIFFVPGLKILAVVSILFLGAPVFGAPSSQNGVQREYYDNGKIQLENVFRNGVVVRKRTYYRNGRLLFEEKYKKGVLVIRRTFYEDGRLKSIWTKKSGSNKFYSDDGKLQAAVGLGQ